MNSVVMVGKLVGVSEVQQRGRWQHCIGLISVARPYKVKGEYKYDKFDFVAWGEYARRISTAQKGQIIGISAGMLERDDTGKVYINVKGVTFYTNEMAQALMNQQPVEEEMENIAGFAAIAASEVPDF